MAYFSGANEGIGPAEYDLAQSRGYLLKMATTNRTRTIALKPAAHQPRELEN